jgi:hypothetical protein
MSLRTKVSRFTITGFLFVLVLMPLGSTLAQDAPDTPVLLSPMDGGVYNTDTPLFEWTDAAADTYKLVIKNADGTKFLKQKFDTADVCDVTGCRYSLVNANLTFTENGEYSWKVVAKNEFGKAKSTSAAFTIDSPGAPELEAPLDGANVTGQVTFSWTEINGATRYVLILKHTGTGDKLKETFDYPVCISGICEYTPQDPLIFGTYTWKVTAQQPPIPNKSKSEKWSFSFGPA